MIFTFRLFSDASYQFIHITLLPNSYTLAVMQKLVGKELCTKFGLLSGVNSEKEDYLHRQSTSFTQYLCV